MALAHFFLSIDSKEQHADQHTQFAEQFLELALTRFPFVLGQILDKLNIQPDSKVDNHSRLGTVAYSRESDGMKLVTEIYLHHSLELWRMPNVISWLEATTHVILPRLSSTLKNETDEWTKKRKRTFVGMPPNVMRHAILHSIRAGGIADPGESSIVDPYPPPTGASFADYQPINLDDVHTGNDDSSDSVLVEFFRSLVPQEYQPQLDSVGGAVRNYATELYSRLRDGLSLNENSQENAQNNDVQNDENREVQSPDIAHDNAEELPGTSASMAAPMPTNHTDSSSENRENQNETNIPGESESQSKEEEQ
ncbi:transcriptional repressor TCF25 domain-containing protein [Ditylenchus destructor]|uniref:Transcriptional repressor TCF25 domain-containing protein n=1 Tax=Ditylenchus destructor TaxID=166010 RepID=A0AAD4N151_9BILA|nr:transcriptional repressor TCF25 domain-containing protein [Ditylenchus destructor]